MHRVSPHAISGPSTAATYEPMSQPETTLSRESSIEERFFKLDGAAMRYLHAGAGPALILIHGLMGCSFSWRHAIPGLAEKSEVFAVDLLGTGYSERPAGLDCSLQATAQRLLRFMDAMTASPFDVLGTSHGGAVAMMAAVLAPERVRRLILVDPINPWSPRGRTLAPFLSSPVIAPLFVKLAHHSPSVQEYYFRRLYGDPRRIQPGTLEGYKKPMELSGSFEYAVSILRTWNRDLHDLEIALPRIADIPTLLIWGDRDAAVAPASAERLKQSFHNCQLVIMPGIGHLPYEEAHDEFNRLVSEFLAQE